MATKNTAKLKIPKEKDPNKPVPHVRLTDRGERCVYNRRNKKLPDKAQKYQWYFEKFIWSLDITKNNTKDTDATIKKEQKNENISNT